MGSAGHDLGVMTNSGSHARSRATVHQHSLGSVLLVAVLVSLAPLAVLTAASGGGLALAFLGGAATGTVVAVGRRRVAMSPRRFAAAMPRPTR